ncbi:MAG: recombinase family protein [Phenylobacterium sp.]|uniref:recombinase family protein n=1 Tax=Phenylobacterium sp. TaxID=1871053 RepID=UPI00273392C6|nr:recombinase family protein [Phenylobacterium sp.]MDP3750083.1 recombinase family protein [Phenylobacterium sp.]
MRATAYLRTSSAANVDGDSPYRQNDAVMGYASRNAVEVVSCFWDAAVSGEDRIEDRAGFLALLDHCATEEIQMVLVEDQARFARHVVTQELGLALLAKRGVRVVTAGGVDLSEDDDAIKVLLRQIVGAMHGYEKRQIVDRLRKGRERIRASQGKCEGRKGHAERHPAIVREAKRLARKSPKTGKARSLRAIAAELAVLGYRSEKGTALSPQIVANIIG